MDISKLMRDIHNASNEAEKQKIEEKIKEEFSSLSESEKESVKNEFSKLWGNKLEETKSVLRKIDIALEIEEISKYISLSKIAKDYFGKSKEWLYQRIKGYNVNGRPAQFTPEERKRLSSALEEISRMAHETSLKIA
ncbi:MAG: DUF5053 domain-containing protein [Candidatus Azobacteroides sp.]|nr:DUF5053 domain-containing protein [Candidatus Azobacteroides sp.]